ncbi:MAG: phage tail fiber protein [Candidatus Adiutrix sp.]
MPHLDISASNATAILTVADIFPAGLALQMFASDQAISQDSLDIAETRMGIDGFMVAGFTPTIHPVTITLEAASPSLAPLSTLWEAMHTNRTIYECTLICDVPSLGRVYTWVRGVLKSGAPFASVKKTLEPTNWLFHFENMRVASRS